MCSVCLVELVCFVLRCVVLCDRITPRSSDGLMFAAARPPCGGRSAAFHLSVCVSPPSGSDHQTSGELAQSSSFHQQEADHQRGDPREGAFLSSSACYSLTAPHCVFIQSDSLGFICPRRSLACETATVSLMRIHRSSFYLSLIVFDERSRSAGRKEFTES